MVFLDKIDFADDIRFTGHATTPKNAWKLRSRAKRAGSIKSNNGNV